uniref:Uncharacterized protein n=1 Tax=Tanacetum cinerariifolium TaxID=118510 RepID=A0A699JQM7_TANCI|nr:hypothetical protein [Tanacetum cinerariifolium]
MSLVVHPTAGTTSTAATPLSQHHHPLPPPPPLVSLAATTPRTDTTIQQLKRVSRGRLRATVHSIGGVCLASETRQQIRGVFVWAADSSAAEAAAIVKGCLFSAAGSRSHIKGCLFNAAETAATYGVFV